MHTDLVLDTDSLHCECFAIFLFYVAFVRYMHQCQDVLCMYYSVTHSLPLYIVSITQHFHDERRQLQAELLIKLEMLIFSFGGMVSRAGSSSSYSLPFVTDLSSLPDIGGNG